LLKSQIQTRKNILPPHGQTGYEVQTGLPSGEKRETLEDIKPLKREASA
jgi:hypothetical protein